jgi:hypothetical protein
MRTTVFSSGLKRQGLESALLAPSSAEAKYVGAIRSFPVRLHEAVKYRDFTFTFSLITTDLIPWTRQQLHILAWDVGNIERRTRCRIRCLRLARC